VEHIFGGLPIQQKFNRLLAGLAVIDLQTGNLVGKFEFTAGCTEIYDVHFLAGARNANILNSHDETARQAFTAPEFSYWLRPENVINDDLSGR